MNYEEAVAEAVIRYCEETGKPLDFYYENIWSLDELEPYIKRILGVYYSRLALIRRLQTINKPWIRLYGIPQFPGKVFIYVNLLKAPLLIAESI